MSNEWLLTDQEIEDICVKAIYSAPDNELVKDVRLTASQAIARAALRKVAERIRDEIIGGSPGETPDTGVYHIEMRAIKSLFQEAGLEARE